MLSYFRLRQVTHLLILYLRYTQVTWWLTLANLLIGSLLGSLLFSGPVTMTPTARLGTVKFFLVNSDQTVNGGWWFGSSFC